jgi:Na+/proline symporter
MSLARADWIIVIVYVASLVSIGAVAGRRIKETDQYFLGKRRFGKLLMIAQNFGVGTHAEMPVSLGGAVFSLGISAIWFQWKNLFATPFYWVMAPVFRRVRRTIATEMVQDRYGAGMAAIYSLFALIFFIINIAGILKGAAKVLNEVVGGNLGSNNIVLGLAAIFVLYSFFGGLVASTWSDCVQGFLIILLSFMLIPLGWSLVGGLNGMKRALPLYYFCLLSNICGLIPAREGGQACGRARFP